MAIFVRPDDNPPGPCVSATPSTSASRHRPRTSRRCSYSRTYPGVTPAPVADAGYLDGLDLTTETFTVVGYGTDDFITGSAASPQAITIFDGVRSYRDVSAITTHDAFPDRFVKITNGVCFGDSGGPMVHGDTVVALNTWTFSYRCDGPNLEYRVDAPAAQEFLDTYL